MYFSALTDALVMNHEDGIHQAILDVTYSDWETAANWSYSDMLKNATKKYGKLATIATLLGKYNQQVTNGGHSQYWDNGYASSTERGYHDRNKDTKLHEEMIAMFEEFGFKDLKHGNVVYLLLKDFLNATKESGPCSDCDGAGGWDEELDGEEDQGWDECYSCGGSGDDDSQIGDTNHLDSVYYEVYEEWIVELETFFRNQISAQG